MDTMKLKKTNHRDVDGCISTSATFSSLHCYLTARVVVELLKFVFLTRRVNSDACTFDKNGQKTTSHTSEQGRKSPSGKYGEKN